MESDLDFNTDRDFDYCDMCDYSKKVMNRGQAMIKIIELTALVIAMWLLGYLMGKIEQQKKDEEDHYYDR